MYLQAIERGSYPKSLFKTLLNEYDLSGVAAIKWGNENEDNAKIAYEKLTGIILSTFILVRFRYIPNCCHTLTVTALLSSLSVTGTTVQNTGLWLHSSGILGASPDGLLPDGKGLVEFKCPYSSRHCSIEETIDTNSKFYLQRDAEGEIQLDKSHGYYHQVYLKFSPKLPKPQQIPLSLSS